MADMPSNIELKPKLYKWSWTYHTWKSCLNKKRSSNKELRRKWRHHTWVGKEWRMKNCQYPTSDKKFKFSWLYNSSFHKQPEEPSSGSLCSTFQTLQGIQLWSFTTTWRGFMEMTLGFSFKSISTNKSMKLQCYPTVNSDQLSVILSDKIFHNTPFCFDFAHQHRISMLWPQLTCQDIFSTVLHLSLRNQRCW